MDLRADGSVALSSIVARLVQREGFADVSFRLGGRRAVYWYGVGLLFGPVVGFVAFGFAWLTGLAGEEIGWRGYMLTRLIDAGVPRPVLVGSILWGLWHVPLIAGGFIYYEHPSRLVAVLLFMVCVIPVGFVLVRARLATGSIWPGVVLHGTHNSVIQGAFWRRPSRAARRRPSGSAWRPGSSSPSRWFSRACSSAAGRGRSGGRPTS